MSTRYRKTDAGREAIRSRSALLSRPARNLLLIIDDSRTGSEWLALVAGAGGADLAQLLDNGFIAATGAAAVLPATGAVLTNPVQPPLVVPPPSSVDLPLHGVTLDEALNALGYRALYDVLTSEAKARLGLIKGYKLVLEIEKCSGVDELRQLARRFIDELGVSHGAPAASAVRIALGADH